MITAQSACGPYEIACGCIGPQNGQPLCPCQMRGVQIKDGRYVRIQDLGPAPAEGIKYETRMPGFYRGEQVWPPKDGA